MHILVTGQGHDTTLLATSAAGACSVGFVDYDTIGGGRCDEGSAVGDASPKRVGVESDVGKTVTERAEQECKVSYKPGESIVASELSTEG